MPQTPVLVDTWAILALANSRDAWHDQAVEIKRQLTDDGRPLVTTDWILTEFIRGVGFPRDQLLQLSNRKPRDEYDFVLLA